MLKPRAFVCFILTFILGVMYAGPAAAADGEIVFVIGGLLGDDFTTDDDAIEAAFDDATLFGGRLGAYGHPWGFEGSVVFSNSGFGPDSDVDVLYAEANVLLIPIPGAVSPFVTGGVGLHRFSFDEVPGIENDQNYFGFNFGGGVKANIGSVVLRGEVRDHVTSIGDEDIDDLDDVDDAFRALFTGDERLHNWEISASVGFRF